MKPIQVQVRRKDQRPEQPIRLRLGADGDDAIFTLQAMYADITGRPVSRSVIVRRALKALLETVSSMDPEATEEEHQRILRVARP